MRSIYKTALCLVFSLLAFRVALPSDLDPQNPQLSHNCDMAAVITHAKSLQNCLIAEMPPGPGEFDDPEDFLYDFIASRSSAETNPNGYRVIFYQDGQTTLPEDQVTWSYPYWSEEHYGVNSGPLNDARRAIMDPENDAVIALAHARKGETGRGNHPFTFAWEDRTWTFMHNGSILEKDDNPNIKRALWDNLYKHTGDHDGAWFEAHPSNWVSLWAVPDYGDYTNFIDSEILFHWIMKNVIENDGDVLAGLYQALTAEIDDPAGGTISLFSQFAQHYDNNKINFVLCDGEALFVFRNTPLEWSWAGHWDHELSYQVYNVEGGFVGVKTQQPLEHRLDQFTLAYIPRLGWPLPPLNPMAVEYHGFLNGYSETREVPAEYATIQAAIEASAHGDVILVRPGSYVENIDFEGKAITLRSDLDGDPRTWDLAQDSTFIDGNRATSTVTFQSGETRLSRLEGFTIMNGRNCTGQYQFGGGVFCRDFSCPTLTRNIITMNRAKYGGGISCLNDASPLISWNTIRDNVSESSGGGLHLSRSLSPITHNLILTNVGGAEAEYDNAQGGGLGIQECDLKLVNNCIMGNFNFFGHAGAISSNASTVMMTNNTVYGNRDGAETCDGIYLYNESTMLILNSILWENSYDPLFEIVLDGPGNVVSLDYSDLQGGQGAVSADPGSFIAWGTGMIDEDPRFSTPGDRHLAALSPCIDKGWNGAPDIPDLDIDEQPRVTDGPGPGPAGPAIPFGGVVDMGADEYPGQIHDSRLLR